EGRARGFMRHLCGGEAAQLVIDQRQQLLCCSGLPLFQGRQNLSNFGHNVATTAALSNCMRLEDRLIKLISDSNLKYAAAKGWQVVELYDLAGLKGWSGKTIREHPLAKKMLADIRSGHIH